MKEAAMSGKRKKGPDSSSFCCVPSLGRAVLILGVCVALAGCGGPSGPSVQGAVIDWTGKQVMGVMVTFWPEGNKDPISTTIDPQGRFHCRCPAGTYKVTVARIGGGGMGGGGPVGGAMGGPPVHPEGFVPIATVYTRPELTPLTVTISSSGDDDLKIPITETGK
jgi:hypothetical protein